MEKYIRFKVYEEGAYVATHLVGGSPNSIQPVGDDDILFSRIMSGILGGATGVTITPILSGATTKEEAITELNSTLVALNAQAYTASVIDSPITISAIVTS
tara:strand:+ start:13357 stop:13659 length:303 start_codon:yes stop_codon:yes gene_type:complete